MKDKIYLFFSFLIFIGNAYSQSTTIKIDLNFNKKPIQLGEKYVSKNDTLSLETIKFYLSSFEINYKDNSNYKETKSYYLIDFENPESLHFPIKNNSTAAIKSIKFNIGVDSLASVSGAMADDLDATNGMYWAWQSGFINMKIEGKSTSCNTRKNQFHFHVGGYLKPNYALRNININCNDKNNQEVIIKVDLSKLFDEVHLSETNSIMIPGKEAMIIADELVKMFSIE